MTTRSRAPHLLRLTKILPLLEPIANPNPCTFTIIRAVFVAAYARSCLSFFSLHFHDLSVFAILQLRGRLDNRENSAIGTGEEIKPF